jgi:beta-barrel assembly-enhancing protease
MQNQSTPEAELEKVLKQWTSTSYGRREFLMYVPTLLALSACASKTSDRSREGDNKGQETQLTYEDEKKMTQEVLPQMKKDYPPVQNPELQSYISNLGNKIVQANKLHQNPYTYNFTVVDVNYVNAFALPAGTVFVTTPLIAMAESEAELAGVVGHEIGHIKARHTAERMDKAKKEQKKSWLYGGIGGVIGAAAGFGLGKALCKPKDNECLAKASLYGAAAGAGGGLLIQKYAFMANSREDEMEADRIGFRTAVAAGFHKDQIGKFYEKLLAMEKASKKNQGNAFLASLSDAMSTHPPSDERVKQMNQMAASEPMKAGAITSSKAFEKIHSIAKKISEEKKAKA